ncbi:DUF2163 domain-containing protein [Rhodobacter sp.]
MIRDGLKGHLMGGATTTCRVWSVTRRDGQMLGFTDHDCDLVMDGLLHRAGSGLTARALQQCTGLAVGNTEAVGALNDDAITERDLAAGRYDAAEVRIWLVNWADVSQRAELFLGSLGEVSRSGAAFRAELRGLSEMLNQPVGLAYTRGCSAVLGDGRCRFDMTRPGYVTEREIEEIDPERRLLCFAEFGGFDDRWFDLGRIDILSGEAAGLIGMVKEDRISGPGRVIELWHGLRAEIRPGDRIRIAAGCDKRPETCRLKFANMLNFRGFPHIPGEDWLTAYPRAGQNTGGGSVFAGARSG